MQNGGHPFVQITARSASGDEAIVERNLHVAIAVEIADERRSVLNGLVAICAQEPPGACHGGTDPRPCAFDTRAMPRPWVKALRN